MQHNSIQHQSSKETNTKQLHQTKNHTQQQINTNIK